MKATVYMLGYDCGKNGPNEMNCHFSLFSTNELTREWERGKADAAAGRAADPHPGDGEGPQ